MLFCLMFNELRTKTKINVVSRYMPKTISNEQRQLFLVNFQCFFFIFQTISINVQLAPA